MLLRCKLQEKLPRVTAALPDAAKINHCIGAAMVDQWCGHKVGTQDSGECDSICSTFLSDDDFEIKSKLLHVQLPVPYYNCDYSC